MNTTKTRIADLKAGDIVAEHGGKFQITNDATVSESHRDRTWDRATCNHVMHTGPVNCAVTTGICIEGEVPGYFKPGSEWVFQGTTAVTVHRVGVA